MLKKKTIKFLRQLLVIKQGKLNEGLDFETISGGEVEDLSSDIQEIKDLIIWLES